MLVTSGGYVGDGANSPSPIVNFEVFMDDIEQLQQAVMEIDAAVQDIDKFVESLETRIANMEALVEKLKDNQITPYERRLLAKLED